MQTVRWAIVDWLDDAHLNGLWGVSVDFPALAIELLNFAFRTSYAPISHSNMRKFVASKSNLLAPFCYGTEADTTLPVSKGGRRITPVSWAIPILHMMAILRGAVSAHAEAKLTPHQRGWISLRNTIVEYRNCSDRSRVRPQELFLGLVNRVMYNASCLLIIFNDGGWYGI